MDSEAIVALFQEHSFDHIDDLPRQCVQILLDDHRGEVWFVKFSYDGNFLVSVIANTEIVTETNTEIVTETAADIEPINTKIIVWKVNPSGTLTIQSTFEHKSPSVCVCWSRNSQHLLISSYGAEEYILWDYKSVENRKDECPLNSNERVGRTSTFLEWLGPRDIAFGALDSPKSIHFHIRTGNHNNRSIKYSRGEDIEDFAVSKNGRKLVLFCPKSKAQLMVRNIARDFPKNQLTTACGAIRLQPNTEIFGFSITDDSENLILNLGNDEIQVWDLNKLEQWPRIYSGLKMPVYSCNACFGGVNSAFLACGSEDSTVHIWSKSTREPIIALKGHLKRVRSVSWNPKRPQMLASASEDGTIRIWGPARRGSIVIA